MIYEYHVWIGMFVIASLILVQSSHRTMVQTARPLYGSGASDVTATPMWEYPGFQPWFYLWSSSWNSDTLLPAITLVLAFWLAIRHHLYRKQTMFLLIVFLTTALLQALVLPVTASRYGYHLTPLWLLVGSAGVVAFMQEITRWRSRSAHSLALHYRRAIVACTLVPFAFLCSGLGTDLSELPNWRAAGKSRLAIKFPGQDRTSKYVLEHMAPDDIVIVNAPHVIDHYLKRPSDYWLQSQLHLQCLLTDKNSIPRHRYKGTPMLSSVEHLQDVFSRNQRIWFVAEPGFNNRTNDEHVVKFVRENMDVVYEDYASLVLFRDQHRSTHLQQKNEKTLNHGIIHLP